MVKKKLKPILPKDENEVFEKGFGGNISGCKKFVTDGHFMFLASSAPKRLVFKKNSDYGNPVTESSIQKCWDTAENRESVSANFIGCGKPSQDMVVAVVRDDRAHFCTFNPWILKFALIATQANAMTVSSGPHFYQEMMVLLRDGKMVGAVMPMRYFESDMSAYDLTVPAIPLSEV